MLYESAPVTSSQSRATVVIAGVAERLAGFVGFVINEVPIHADLTVVLPTVRVALIRKLCCVAEVREERGFDTALLTAVVGVGLVQAP